MAQPKLTTTYLGKGTISERAPGRTAGDGTITVTLTEKDGKKNAKPVVMKFQKDGASLKLVDYDKNVWGSEGLTPRPGVRDRQEAERLAFPPSTFRPASRSIRPSSA